CLAVNLSDLYAMGAEPLTALAIVCFPSSVLGAEVLVEILQGGAEVVHAAGAVILGGHSVMDPELKYGLAVTGRVDPKKMRTNQGACPGEAVILTKPLGTGLVANALKAGQLKEDDPRVQEVVASMAALNKIASEVLARHACRCATDVTGFGLLGHARALAQASGVGLRLRPGAFPHFPVARELAEVPLAGGAADNRDAAAPSVDRAEGLADADVRLGYDAQTSGGLLATVAADAAEAIVAELHAAGITAAAVIGEVTDGPPGRIALSS
ncbi:MAG: selenide, water dikinase SelD, partial [Planctomycetes bacterium]|nr:selenide, water dikinase SelD [Planctomycetota bacterium]